jgi:hypothetical protein
MNNKIANMRSARAILQRDIATSHCSPKSTIYAPARTKVECLHRRYPNISFFNERMEQEGRSQQTL